MICVVSEGDSVQDFFLHCYIAQPQRNKLPNIFKAADSNLYIWKKYPTYTVGLKLLCLNKLPNMYTSLNLLPLKILGNFYDIVLTVYSEHGDQT